MTKLFLALFVTATASQAHVHGHPSSIADPTDVKPERPGLRGMEGRHKVPGGQIDVKLEIDGVEAGDIEVSLNDEGDEVIAAMLPHGRGLRQWKKAPSATTREERARREKGREKKARERNDREKGTRKASRRSPKKAKVKRGSAPAPAPAPAAPAPAPAPAVTAVESEYDSEADSTHKWPTLAPNGVTDAPTSYEPTPTSMPTDDLLEAAPTSMPTDDALDALEAVLNAVPLCPAPYNPSTFYVAGDFAEVHSNVYKCRSVPYEAYCSIAFPHAGWDENQKMLWDEAWDLVEGCQRAADPLAATTTAATAASVITTGAPATTTATSTAAPITTIAAPDLSQETTAGPLPPCPSSYDHTKTYTAGDKITVKAHIFKCNDLPEIEAYCNDAVWDDNLLAQNENAKELWEQAWVEVGPCELTLVELMEEVVEEESEGVSGEE